MGFLVSHSPLKMSVKCWFLLSSKSKDVPEIWGIQGCTSLDSTTVEVLSLRSLLTIVPFCWASQPKILAKECLYCLTSTPPLAQRARALSIWQKEMQWREEMYLSIRSLKRRVKIIVCLFIVPFQERRICAILQQEILGHPEVTILQSIWFSIWAHSVSKIRYPNTLHVVWECTLQ